MDEMYMERAIKLALMGKGKVNPNPMVGAVIVKEGKIIGEGYHERYGENHAEVNAFLNAKEDVKGATLYVTLEPCSHYGKTPPCVDLVIKKGIRKVVIGTLDPNPLVSGRSVQKLKNALIEVKVGVLNEQCLKLNEIFMKYIRTKEPFVLMKVGSSIDGKIATRTGESRWITGDESRKRVHELRREYSAIMVGTNTVIEDDPELTCRIEDGVNPIRIVVDSTLRIPVISKLIATSKEVRTIVATTKKADKSKALVLEDNGVDVLFIKEKDNRVNLKELIKELGKMNIDSILLEGGSTLNYSALKEEIVDKVQFYIAPKIIGGEKAKTSVDGNGIDILSECFKLKNLTTDKVGEDILIEGYIERSNRCLQE